MPKEINLEQMCKDYIAKNKALKGEMEQREVESKRLQNKDLDANL